MSRVVSRLSCAYSILRSLREVLAVRGLAQRGKLSTEHRALNFLANQGDNGIVWTVLSYWRATS